MKSLFLALLAVLVAHLVIRHGAETRIVSWRWDVGERPTLAENDGDSGGYPVHG
jgi:hypothetical protein